MGLIGRIGSYSALAGFFQRSMLFHDSDVFVAPAGEVHHDHGLRGQLALLAHDVGQGVGALQGREDSFDPRQQLEGVEHVLVIGRRHTGPGRCP